VREAYRFVASHDDQSDRNIVDNVWHRHIPTKVSLFVWRLLCNRLPTRGNLLRRNIVQANNSLRVFGCEVVETAGHLFLSCGNYCILWSLISALLGLSLVHHNDLQQHYHHFYYMHGGTSSEYSCLFSRYLVCFCLSDMERQKQTYLPKRGITLSRSYGEN
jgi:hypothetical protein